MFELSDHLLCFISWYTVVVWRQKGIIALRCNLGCKGTLEATWPNVTVLKIPKPDTLSEESSQKCWIVGNSLFSCPAGYALTNAAHGFVDLHWCKGTLMAGGFSTATVWSSSIGLSFLQSVPNLYGCMELFNPRCMTLHLPLLNFMRFLPAFWGSSGWRTSNTLLLPPFWCKLLHHSVC